MSDAGTIVLRYASAIEVYPVWSLTDSPEFSGDIGLGFSAAEIADYARVQAEYDAWQDKIAARYQAARDSRDASAHPETDQALRERVLAIVIDESDRTIISIASGRDLDGWARRYGMRRAPGAAEA